MALWARNVTGLTPARGAVEAQLDRGSKCAKKCRSLAWLAVHLEVRNRRGRLLGLRDVEGGDALRVPVNAALLPNWLAGTTPAQQLAHPDTPLNPHEAGSPRSTLRAV